MPEPATAVERDVPPGSWVQELTVARDEQGQPLASPETVVLLNVPRKDGKKTNIIVRGTSSVEAGWILC